MFKRFPFVNNHGDFVHLDALRVFLKGVPSLETFLKYKNDKAIVKDMHFTDEKTTVDYLDTIDDTMRESTLCEYLTSDVYDETDSTKFNKVKKIRFRRNKLNENYVDIFEKEDGKKREAVIKSSIPLAYDATDDYKTSSKAHHVGFDKNGIKIYDDTTLKKVQQYQFPHLIAYPAGEKYGDGTTTDLISNIGFSDYGVYLYKSDRTLYKKIPFGNIRDVTLTDCNPFSSITGRNEKNDVGDLELAKDTDFRGLKVDDRIVSGQIMYTVTGDLTIKAGTYVELMLTPGTMGKSIFSQNVYPKTVQVLNNQHVITTITKNSSYPLNNDMPTYVMIYNPSSRDVAVEYLHFTF